MAEMLQCGVRSAKNGCAFVAPRDPREPQRSDVVLHGRPLPSLPRHLHRSIRRRLHASHTQTTEIDLVGKCIIAKDIQNNA